MVAIGEKSGRLEAMLGKAGRAFTNDVNATVAGLTTLISPIMTIVLGGLVFFIVMAVLLPMTQMMNLVKPG
jgi:type II secretory pathway component PulF